MNIILRDHIPVRITPKEICPVCLKENCDVRITRNAIPGKLELREVMKYKLSSTYGKK